MLARDERPERLVFGEEGALLERLVHERAELRRRERLRDEVVAPRFIASIAVSSVEWAVITMTSVCALRFRATLRRSSPEPSGIRRSVRTIAKGFGAPTIASRPAWHPGATSRRTPPGRNRIESMSRSPGSSSTTRTLPLAQLRTSL